MKLECHREVWIEYSRVINVCLSDKAINQVIPRSGMLLQKLTANFKISPYVIKPAILCPVHKLPLYCLKIQFNIISVLRTRPSEWPTVITLFNNNSMHICDLPFVLHVHFLLPSSRKFADVRMSMASQWEKDKKLGSGLPVPVLHKCKIIKENVQSCTN